MKTKEIKELETKELAERLETEVAKYNQMKFNHNVTPLENPSLASLQTYVWVKVRETPQDGWHLLHQVVFFSKSRAYLLILPKRLCAWALRNCR